MTTVWSPLRRSTTCVELLIRAVLSLPAKKPGKVGQRARLAKTLSSFKKG